MTGCGASPDGRSNGQGFTDAGLGFKSADAAGDAGMAPEGADPSCDLTGIWAVRVTTHVQSVAESTVSYWHYMELSQDGEQLEIVNHFDCGYGAFGAGISGITLGSADASFTEFNSQVGRRATVTHSGEHCDVHFERFWSVRGGSPDKYLPKGHADPRDLAQLQKDAPLPTPEQPEGQEDWDRDEHPGVTVLIGSNDARYSVTREWSEWFSCNGGANDLEKCQSENGHKYALPAASKRDTIQMQIDFDGEDSPLGASSPIYQSNGQSLRVADNRVTLKYLGVARSSPLASTIWREQTVAQKCAVVQKLLPADTE
jgi:hypothetical protein